MPGRGRLWVLCVFVRLYENLVRHFGVFVRLYKKFGIFGVSWGVFVHLYASFLSGRLLTSPWPLKMLFKYLKLKMFYVLFVENDRFFRFLVLILEKTHPST